MFEFVSFPLSYQTLHSSQLSRGWRPPPLNLQYRLLWAQPWLEPHAGTKGSSISECHSSIFLLHSLSLSMLFISAITQGRHFWVSTNLSINFSSNIYFLEYPWILFLFSTPFLLCINLVSWFQSHLISLTAARVIFPKTQHVPVTSVLITMKETVSNKNRLSAKLPLTGLGNKKYANKSHSLEEVWVKQRTVDRKWRIAALKAFPLSLSVLRC